MYYIKTHYQDISMKKVNYYNHEEDSLFYKKNLKIHNSLWKVYCMAIVISLVLVAFKGIS